MLEVRIIKGTKRVGEVFEIHDSLEEIITVPASTATGTQQYIKRKFYVVMIDGNRTLLDPADCEIALPLNLTVL